MTANAKHRPVGTPPASVTISDEAFGRLLAGRARGLLALAGRLKQCERPTEVLTRPMLGQMLSQATQLEELLDAYGAQGSHLWHPLRSLVATIKGFSGIQYTMLHVRHSLPIYRLLPIEGDFTSATTDAIAFTTDILVRTSETLIQQAEKLSLPLPRAVGSKTAYREELPPGRLPPDRRSRAVRSAAAAVAHVATAFLSQAAESELLHIHERVAPKDYASCIPSPVNEQELRWLAERFHNLQSMYDTHVLATQTESLDNDLPTLRGHISVIFHLLEIATGLVHHYQRHMGAGSVDSPEARRLAVLTPGALLRTLMDYVAAYASRYLLRAQSLCQSMLKRYAEVGRIVVSAPPYRGFHVRPATLVAKIVLHYGSEVRMELGDEEYDAASPMDIFRANEKINAQKRRWLAAEIEDAHTRNGPAARENLPDAVRRLVLKLEEQGKVVIYQRPLKVPPAPQQQEGRIMAQSIIEEVSRLQGTGTIDMDTQIEVAFHGDKRVLADIRLLAESGYGEDNFGNNIALPKELSYLRR